MKILGTGEKPEQNGRLYHLLFLYEMYCSDYNITDKDLDKFLSYVPASRENLVAENVYALENGTEIICYKPLRDISIISAKIKEIGNAIYNIKLPGLSITDFSEIRVHSITFRLSYLLISLILQEKM